MDIPKEEETTAQETSSETTSESTSTTETEGTTTQESSGKPNKAGIYPICNGAECMCDQSKEKLPALLKVISHGHVYINDKDGAEKLIATTNDLPLPFEKQANTFGTCLKQPLGFGQYKACIPNITKWDKSYQAIKLAQAGNGEALLEESEGECSFKGKITFTTHGQSQVVTISDVSQVSPEVAQMLLGGLLDEEEIEKLAKGEFEDKESIEILDINVKGALAPDDTGTYRINQELSKLTFQVNNPKTITKEQASAINWAVYVKNKNGIYRHHHTFIDHGKTFVFPYRTLGTYAIEAYGDTKKFDTNTGKGVASNLLEIAYQQIKGLTLYGNEDNRTHIKQIRPKETIVIATDTLFPDGTAIKHKDIYWEVICNKESIDFERVTGSTQIKIKPQLNTSRKEVTVNAALNGKTESITFTIKNNVVARVSADKNTISVLNQGESAKERHQVTFTAHYVLPYNQALGDAPPKWCIYDKGEAANDNNIVANENGLTYTGTSEKEGEWHVEAFAKYPNGTNATIKAIQPKITKAYWADKNGNSISKSGFEHKVYIHIETVGLQGEQLQPNVWFGKKGSTSYTKQQANCIEIEKVNGIINQGFKLPKYEKTDNLEYFFTIEEFGFYVQGTDQFPKANNEYIISDNCTPKYLNVSSKKKITGLKIYESDGSLHTGIIKYGDTVNIKLSSRNFVGETLNFEVFEDVKQDNYTDNYSSYDTMDDVNKNITVCVEIDDEGNGETTFAIPQTWESEHKVGKEGIPRMFYLKCKETEEEFPRAYFIKNVNQGTEEKKQKNDYELDIGIFSGGYVVHKRINALMLKVATSVELSEATEKNNAVILGEELTPIEKNNLATCEPLSWGKKLSCDERKKVIEIAERLQADPNIFMCAMALETGGKFDPSIQNKKTKATGLIQFMPDTARGLDTSVQELKKMTVLEQLDYVEKHLKSKKGKLNTLVDFYLAILFPVDCGKGNEPNHIVFDKTLELDYKNNEVVKNTKYYRYYGYDANSAFHKEKPENNKTYVWEIKKEIERWELQGKGFVNKCKRDTSNCKYGSSTAFAEGVCPDCGQVHIDLRGDNNKWKTQEPQECWKACIDILTNYSLPHLSGYPQNRILVSKQEGTTMSSLNDYQMGIDYIDNQLKLKNPVLVGVDRSVKISTYNSHKATDHFVVIVGKICKDSKVSYIFYEVGTSHKDKGTSSLNLLSLEDNFIKGSPVYNSAHKYTVTEIRKNK
ncbi:DUF4280 domain-containing protein [Joostella atrarenae]|uniref:DUF4280 domain-containing protein n=2 Tax=Joostella atrarenae TaxID=679257 RepID=A0ABS9J4I2_9FLAO|nr:DUF4280 domain-containing protein [Joostella atrarenae]